MIDQILDQLLSCPAVKATKYLRKDWVIKITRKTFNKKLNSTSNHQEFLLTIGRPNYLERIFIKQCLKAKEPFPIKKIQLKYLTLRKRK